MMDLISILMPTYNVSEYVEEAIESIINQTYKDFELIIVDDASTDDTYEKVERLAQNDSRIKCFRNLENKKISITLNIALSKAKGSYIARMDGDDISLPKRLEVLKTYLDEHPDCDLVGSQVISVNEQGNILSYKKYLRTSEFIKFFMKFTPCVSHIWLAKKEVYDELNGYRNIPYAEDYDFLLRGLSSGYHYANTKEYLYKVRIRNGNTATTQGIIQRKTKNYVYKLYKKEKKSKIDMFNKDDLINYIYATEKEKNNYTKSTRYMNEALKNRKRIIFCFISLFKSSIHSIYMLNYICSSFLERVGIYIEDIKFPRMER